MAEITIPSELSEKLRTAKKVVALTGAGISAESGLATFRDAQTGLWAKYRPEELATPQAFIDNPELVWNWYAWRRELAGQAKPNPGHAALVEMAAKVPEFLLVTQNIDGLHQQAGSRHVIELHGNIHRTKRFDDNQIVTEWEETGEVPPRCPATNSLLRPDVVWFGENLPPGALAQAAIAAAECDIFFSIGTSSVVFPAAGLIGETLRNGGLTVEINPGETPHSSAVSFVLRGPAGSVLPALVQQTWP